jgi:hypothetical protein
MGKRERSEELRTNEKPAKQPKVTKFSDDEEEKPEVDPSPQSDPTPDHEPGSTTTEIQEPSGITWDDFTGYGAKQILGYYPFAKLEQFYEEQLAIYPWMELQTVDPKKLQFAYHLCNCKKKYTILLKKGRRVTRQIPQEILEKHCADLKIAIPSKITKEILEELIIDDCLRHNDQWFESIKYLLPENKDVPENDD